MADEADAAQEYEQHTTDAAIARVLMQAPLAAGKPGDCDLCGEHFGRLVGGACPPCRDLYGMP